MNATLIREAFGIFVSICGLAAMNAAPVPLGTRETLAEFETGAKRATRCAGDYAIGSAKEISRFQILPSVWREYSGPPDYHNPNAAWTVTRKILMDREAEFHRATGRQWDAFDLYLMWNAPGVYRRAGWDRAKVSRVVFERAKRFEILMQERQRQRMDLAAQSRGQSIARN
jgi:hypothetical protein